MTRDREQAPKAVAKPQPPTRDSAREHRLAAALRENLKRRKAQARARTASDRNSSSNDD